MLPHLTEGRSSRPFLFSYVRDIFIPRLTRGKSEGGAIIPSSILPLVTCEIALPLMTDHYKDRGRIGHSFLSPYLGPMGEISSYGVGLIERAWKEGEGVLSIMGVEEGVSSE